VVYVGNSGTQLFVRALDALEPVAVFTGAPHSPFVSPDGQWIGFVDANALKKVTVTGGPAVTVAAIGVDRGATWVPDDTIIFAGGNPNTGLQRIAAAGGTPTVLTRADRAQGEVDHLWPEQLPGGRAVLFTITTMTGGLDAAQIAVLDLQTGEHTILVRGGTHAHYVPSGHLVYAAAGTLRAVPFDLTTLETRGTPVPVISDVVTTNSGAVNAAMAGNGTLAYVSGTARAVAPRTLVWVDLSGNEEALKVPARAYVYPRLSPDGTRLAVDVRDQEEDIWIVNDLARATLARFSFGPSPDRAPVWTPDGQRIVWSSARAGVSNLYWQAADGAGVIDRLTQSSNPQFASGFSPDGTRLVIREGAAASRDLMIVPMDQGVPQASRGRGEPRQSQPLLQTPFMETSAEISPNGRWIAYQSDESGQDEIYVRPFPDVETGRWQVSAGGGTKPLWARSGQELFYLVRTKAGAAVMSTPIEPGASFATGIPTKAVEGSYLYGTSGSGDTAFRTYDVSVDGRRFLMVREGGGTDQAAPPINLIVVQNWTEDLKRLVPTN
jgi:serine/threonine-protein kinase